MRQRFRLIATGLAIAVQLPAVLWLSFATHTAWPVFAAAAISFPYLRTLRSPWASESTSLAALIALAWWMACLSFAFLLPLAALAQWLGVARAIAFGVAGGIALMAGASSVSGSPRVRERIVRIADLPAALEGYRIGQISDVHCGPNTSPTRVRQWVDRLNALDLDLMTVTGDLITSGAKYVAPVSEALGHLRARDGVYACMGNHDYFGDGEHIVRELESHGLVVLRNRGVVIDRAGAELYVAGVDDTWTDRNDVRRALQKCPRTATSVLLAHDPALFLQAAEYQVDLTLSGHTHGGQLAVPGVRRWSLARLAGEFTSGLYQRGRSWLYVNRGAGTTGPPVRFGAPAELAVLTLKRAA